MNSDKRNKILDEVSPRFYSFSLTGIDTIVEALQEAAGTLYPNKNIGIYLFDDSNYIRAFDDSSILDYTMSLLLSVLGIDPSLNGFIQVSGFEGIDEMVYAIEASGQIADALENMQKNRGDL